MVKEDLFDTAMLGATDEMFNSRIAENKVAGMRSYTDATWFNQLVEGVEEAEYTVIAPIKAVEGITPYLLTDAVNLCYNKMGITKAATPEVVEGIIGFMISPLPSLPARTVVPVLRAQTLLLSLIPITKAVSA